MADVLIVVVVIAALLAMPGAAYRQADKDITTIYLVSSCHLDVGFANTAANIVNEYFQKYFPEAVQIAEQLRASGGEERLVFTTHSFLVYLYLNCRSDFEKTLGLQCPNSTQVAAFSAAVKRGDIVWHAFPFNAQMEFYDAAMADFGFNVTHMLDAQFSKSPANTMSQRDVPGTTRSIIPILVRNGVKAITVGVNTASMPPAVPTAFVWRDLASGEEILAMWHPHGYGGSSGVGLDSMVIVPGMQAALAFAIRGDNSGPPQALEVIKNYKTLQALFPKAKIIASGYDTFVNELENFRAKLPVVLNEIGDTWIHGVASDPWKTAATREVMRLRSACIDTGKCSLSDPAFVIFSLFLLKNGEHTWGKDVKVYLHDYTHWNRKDFYQMIDGRAPNFMDMISSWNEQRLWGIGFATSLLSNHTLQGTIEESLTSMIFDGKSPIAGHSDIDPTSKVTCGDITIGFNLSSGAINYLVDGRPSTPITYADQTNPLAQVVYQTFTAEDFKTFLDEYDNDPIDFFFVLDFGKLGLNGTKKINESPKLLKLWQKQDSDSCDLVVPLGLDAESIEDYGGPVKMFLQATIPKSSSVSGELAINLTLYFTEKPSIRSPESLSLYFNPVVSNSSSMAISKLGESFNVLDVATNGSKHLHASDFGVSYASGLRFTAWDTSVVCVGKPTSFPTPMQQPNVDNGFAFNVYNNIWGTNYIMWYPYNDVDSSSKYRFTVTLPKPNSV